MKIINNLNPLVIIVWEDFEKVLKYLPKSELIGLFFEGEDTCDMENMTHDDIISQIFLEYEEDIRGGN